ncbi:MAG: ammonium transporter [Deltaproteobacteria bacterium]|nr:ammonium transporter [Deltaproteobacteria bacterium]
MKKFLVLTVILLGCLVLPAFGLEGKIDGKEIPSINYALDTVWVILAAVLVFFMQAGFALVESGFTRAKNAVNIMMKNMIDLSVGVISFWLLGFAIMFGTGNAIFGFSGFLVDASKVDAYASLTWSSVPVMAAFIFQAVFAATAATIISGAVAERIKFGTYMMISAAVTIVIYPISGHWGWGGGWLSELGFTDFAGSTIVHAVGGFAALAVVLILGPRKGKFGMDGKAIPIPGHNIPLATLGVLILWMGWYGFNAGSTMGADAGAIGHIAVTTTLSAAAASLTAFFVTYSLYKKADVGMTLNGALAGLVGITAGCANVTGVGSLLIGIVSGVVVVFSVLALDKVKIDDPVGAISVHGVCGAIGTILLGFLHSESGVFYAAKTSDGLSFLCTQALGVISIAAWAFISTYVIVKVIDTLFNLRVNEEEEFQGLDYSEHGASAYADFNIRQSGGF